MLDNMLQYYNFFNSFDIIFLFYNLNIVFVILHSGILDNQQYYKLLLCVNE
jgi:hypothetical protein